jgi:hypothetical protein
MNIAELVAKNCNNFIEVLEEVKIFGNVIEETEEKAVIQYHDKSINEFYFKNSMVLVYSSYEVFSFQNKQRA